MTAPDVGPRLDPTKPTPQVEHPHGTIERWRAGCICTPCERAGARQDDHVQHRRAQADAQADTRPPANVRRYLRDIGRDLDRTNEIIGPAWAVLTWATADGFPAGGGARSNGTGDPTGAAVVARADEATRAARARIRKQLKATDPDAPDELAEATIIVRRLIMVASYARSMVDDLDHIRRLNPRLAELAWQKLRCSGGEGEWADPTCNRMKTTKAGLCDPCDRRRRRWQERRAATT